MMKTSKLKKNNGKKLIKTIGKEKVKSKKNSDK